MKLMWAKQKAFTIVELLIVIVVIAILAAVIIVAYTGIQGRANVASLQSMLSQASVSLESERAQSTNEAYPSSLPQNIPTGDATSYYAAFTALDTTSAYCLTRTSRGVSYFITSANTTPTPGSCEGMIGWWPLNGNTDDDSGYAYNGTANNLTAATGQNGEARGAYSFNGGDSYVNLANASTLPSGLADRSMCSWGNTDTVNNGHWMMAYGSPNGKQAMFIGQVNNNLYGGGYSADAVFGGYWTTGAWRHVCLTYDGTIARLYADGQERATRTDAWNLVKSVAYIGRQVNGYEWWAGSIDDVRLYNRVLPPSEIQALYAAGAQ
ncbi:prepilin-type N-terminal cleavage/methylation domain-containing protein [Candidatus Saccharibacteria bacterium]|nr:prepilin-type N-terminal cleavage/methylation domain-containing protein [Candidatus Saccharibacteria bacterium]